jgi:hypothetical protein
MKDAASIAALRLQIVAAGWNCVPSSPNDKACYVKGWPDIETSEHHIDNWAHTSGAHSNTAIVCNKNYVAVDIDIASNVDLALQVQALAFQHLGATDFIRVGRAPKRLLVYRQLPGSITSVSYKSAAANGDGVEILSKGKNFVAFGLHPETGSSYTWIGDANPAEDTPADAPLVTQEQVDTFLDAVHAAMPFVGANGTRRPNVADAQPAVNADGLIIDGRENFLRDCIYRAANEIYANGDPLTPQAVVARGWDLFVARAWLGDGKWREKDALAKARMLVRRVNSGRIKLTGNAHRLREAAITYPNIDKNKDANRSRLEQLLATFANAAISRFSQHPADGASP